MFIALFSSEIAYFLSYQKQNIFNVHNKFELRIDKIRKYERSKTERKDSTKKSNCHIGEMLINVDTYMYRRHKI